MTQEHNNIQHAHCQPAQQTDGQQPPGAPDEVLLNWQARARPRTLWGPEVERLIKTRLCQPADFPAGPPLSNKDWALIYAREGLEVFPVCWPDSQGKCGCGGGHSDRETGKAPYSRTAPKGMNSASSARGVVGRMWSGEGEVANIGLRLPPDIMVLDVDPRNGGEASYRRLLEDYPALEKTLRVKTGGGGYHLYLLKPEWLAVKAGEFQRRYPGIDIKDGGHVTPEGGAPAPRLCPSATFTAPLRAELPVGQPRPSLPCAGRTA
jgi:hypothetical protein